MHNNLVDLASSISDGTVVGHMTIEGSKNIGQFKPYVSSGLTSCVEFIELNEVCLLCLEFLLLAWRSWGAARAPPGGRGGRRAAAPCKQKKFQAQ
jgi:hypothetical protein